jgi:CspA family cold shock protein
MQAGTVKWFDAAKGFGFVIPKDGGQDIYVHLKVLQKASLQTLEPGTTINFSVATRGGKQFVEEIAVVAKPAPPLERTPIPKSPRPAVVEDEDAFEREWGLRRA